MNEFVKGIVLEAHRETDARHFPDLWSAIRQRYAVYLARLVLCSGDPLGREQAPGCLALARCCRAFAERNGILFDATPQTACSLLDSLGLEYEWAYSHKTGVVYCCIRHGIY